jgi:nucleoside-diphosphate-sugar epimerase
MKDGRIVITGGAGLVGQNLVLLLHEAGYRDLVVIDKQAGV